MSAARGLSSPVRDGLDRYYTPPTLAHAVVRLLTLGGCSVADTSAGAGAWLDAAVSAGAAGVSGCDADPEAAAIRHHLNVWHRDWMTTDIEPVDWIIGNPPFRHAQEHIERMFGFARLGVVQLVRQGFLAGKARAPWWAERRPANIIILSERPSFTGGATDAADYCVVVWLRQADGSWRAPETRAQWLSWKTP